MRQRDKHLVVVNAHEHPKFLRSIFRRQSFAAGEVIIRRGEPASELYLLMSGQVTMARRLNEEVAALSR